ncbi:MAG: hypothetical protein LKK21_07245 [Prevotella sp.]|jgi:hypothetical protein|nr:hypothetical protein [Prevotella sp.]MCI2088021.1 hypothetical protein [Prevotella sp.]MCI2125424.1 hypothetical protein [Prevotella sp.]
MINRAVLAQWSEFVPWTDNAQVEQDLIICGALIAIFSDEFTCVAIGVSRWHGLT